MASSDEEWIESIRSHHESEKEWALKRSFLESHADKYDKNRLVCLANCFVNIELYGCSYPDPVMSEVNGLAAQIPQLLQYRNERKEREAKRIAFVKQTSEPEIACVGPRGCGVGSLVVKLPVTPPTLASTYPEIYDQVKGQIQLYTESIESVLRINAGVEDAFILTYDRNSQSMLTNSLAQVKVAIDADRDEQLKRFELRLGETMVASMPSETTCLHLSHVVSRTKSLVKRAGAMLCHHVLQYLIDRCWLIIRKDLSAADQAVTADNMKNQEPGSTDIGSSKGMSLLKSLGWSEGSGLGVRSQGIKQPVSLETTINRQGIGYCDSLTNLRDSSLKFFEEYLREQKSDVLVFSSEFTTEDRKVLHQVASRLGLRTRSRGKGADRCLMVWRKGLSIKEQIASLVRSGIYETDWCVIVPPQSTIQWLATDNGQLQGAQTNSDG